MRESESPSRLSSVRVGLALAAAPIVALFAGSLLFSTGVLAHPGGTFAVAITPYVWASALLVPIGLLVVGLALPVKGWQRLVVVGAILLVGVPVLLGVWFVTLLMFSGAMGEPF